MVTVDLMGYIGNQMFQIAACIGYAEEHGLEYHINGVPNRSDIWPTYFTHLRNHSYNPFLEEIKIVEPHFHYAELPFEEGWRNKNIKLTGRGYETGYYQSYKYFDHLAENLKWNFGFKLHGEIIPGTTSLHLRTGDYLANQNYFSVITESYLKQAIHQIIKQTNSRKFIVFGNSIEWNRDMIDRIKMPGEYIFSEGKSPLEDMKLMSRCENNVIGNSSFSWWAAYLNLNQNKIIIAPDEDSWFGKDNKHNDPKDLIPPEWIRMHY